MKRQHFFTVVLALALLLAVAVGLNHAQEPLPGKSVVAQDALGTAFTYQGNLTDGGNPANGLYDFMFDLYDAASGGSHVGSTVTVDDQEVTDGLFTAKLDFGSSAFSGDARYLEIAVRAGSSSEWYIVLGRTELTPAPHALALPGLWTQQNATSPNLIGGYSGNSVTAGAVGAAIGGGGNSYELNLVTDDYGTIGGGSRNQAGNDDGDVTNVPWATVGGGRNNTASGDYSTIAGGVSNMVTATVATIGGGSWNTASGEAATVAGGTDNTASGNYATVAGGADNFAGGDYSFAAGRLAGASHDGTFVWADSTYGSFASTGNDQFLIRALGGVGIGTTWPSAPLHVLHNDPSGEPSLILENKYPTGHAKISFQVSYAEQAYIYANVNGATVYNTNGGGMYFRSDGSNRMIIHDSGTVELGVLQITGGSDIAEPFDVGEEDAVKTGMVLVIDSEHPGKLKISDRAYDRRVAGVVSGAGGIEPGMVMGQSGSVADGEYPVALTGRVYCWADASNGPIEPGDLLTTSDTPGHAMKVTDYAKAQGAILGKAMSSLEKDQGLILVLVSLQ